MPVDLKKWKQRNAAERVKAALTRPKKDNTAERLRRQFTLAATKASEAIVAKGRHPWLKFGFNGDVVVTAKLGARVIPVTGDEAIALPPKDAQAFLKDVVEATNSGQLDKLLLATVPAPAPKKPPSKAKAASGSQVVEARGTQSITTFRPNVVRAPIEAGLMGER
jgi:hypothetical protein